jgi:hypothetical protein
MKERRERLFYFQKEVEQRLHMDIFTVKQALLGLILAQKAPCFGPCLYFFHSSTESQYNCLLQADDAGDIGTCRMDKMETEGKL